MPTMHVEGLVGLRLKLLTEVKDICVSVCVCVHGGGGGGNTQVVVVMVRRGVGRFCV